MGVRRDRGGRTGQEQKLVKFLCRNDMQSDQSDRLQFSKGPILRGSGIPTSKTDQECPHCGTWFTSHGIDNHLKSCPVAKSDVFDYEMIVEITNKCESCGYWGATHRADCPTQQFDPPEGLERVAIV